MNAKLCKKLRKIAAITQPSRITSYQRLKPSEFFTGQVVLNKNCFRAIYQSLKKQYA
jgi:hypothetical protein